MAVIHIERTSLQELLRAIFRADRHLTILRKYLCQILNSTDDLDGQGAQDSLQSAIHHLERMLYLVKINRLLHLVTFQRHLYLQFRHHGLVPPIDWDFKD